ncbi:hypothetical protein F383_30594 [Gossypium arboreum]|uniref:Uncharacterized protein n=1 Tax=Gossypium arboreum TaxID=29729 RepID=A0A0B0PLP1_GOSAR|nr:hypothetical protein F383_30594 [Gossypium arboreum]
MSHIPHISYVHECTYTYLLFSHMIYLSSVPELDTHLHTYLFIRMSVELYEIK